MSDPSKNIIIIGPAYPLRAGGMASFNERLAYQLQEEGHKVTLYSFSLQYPSFLFPGTTQYSTEAAPPNLNIKVAINSINPFNWIKVGNEIKKANADIIIVRYWLPFMGPCLGTILRRAKKNKHSKIICIADNIIPHEKRIADKSFTKYFVKPVDAFICMSEKVKQDIRVFDQEKPVSLIPHPLYDNFGEKVDVITARQKLNIPAGDFVILFFGFIRKYKGLDIYLNALPEIIKNIPQAKLLIAGEFYGNETELKQLIEKLEIKNHLFLHTNFIANNDIKYYFGAADMVVQPYRNATQSGVTPLAYHFETPMLVTNVGGLPDMVPSEKIGLIAEPNSEDLAKKTITFYKKGKDYFLPSLIEQKKLYSWENLTSEILHLESEMEGYKL